MLAVVLQNTYLVKKKSCMFFLHLFLFSVSFMLIQVRVEGEILDCISENAVTWGITWFNAVVFWWRYLLRGGIKLAEPWRLSIYHMPYEPSQTSVVIFAKTEEQTIRDWYHKPEPAKQVCYLVGRRQSITKPSIEGGERTKMGT